MPGGRNSEAGRPGAPRPVLQGRDPRVHTLRPRRPAGLSLRKIITDLNRSAIERPMPARRTRVLLDYRRWDYRRWDYGRWDYGRWDYGRWDCRRWGNREALRSLDAHEAGSRRALFGLLQALDQLPAARGLAKQPSPLPGHRFEAPEGRRLHEVVIGQRRRDGIDDARTRIEVVQRLATMPFHAGQHLVDTIERRKVVGFDAYARSHEPGREHDPRHTRLQPAR
jgi:hypothetical protein